MAIHDREQRAELDNLVEEYTEKNLSRRDFMRRAVAAGLSMSAAGALLAACGGSGGGSGSKPAHATSVDVITVWGAEELASFQAVTAGYTQQNSSVKVNIESTRDLDAVLTTRIRGNNPPDVADLPNPGKMQQLAKQGKLIPLDSFLDMNQIRNDYAKAWLDLGSYNGKLYALFYKAANKATVWYNPKQFQANNYQTPSTWQDMITLSNNIASGGKYPWSMGVSSQAASGWPATDWVAQIFLSQSGPDMYDKWVAHSIPWTDNSVKSAHQMFAQIFHGNHYINGAPQSILATGFQEASYLPFNSPPQAYMYYEGDFVEGFITGQFKSAQPGTDFNFFPFPTISGAGGVTGGADVIVMMKNTDAAQSFVKYLATAQAQEIWVKRGGFTSVNKSVNLSDYPDQVAQNSAKMLTSAQNFRFGAGDIMPPAVQQAWWKGMLTYIASPDKLDSVLSDIESVAQQSYSS